MTLKCINCDKLCYGQLTKCLSCATNLRKQQQVIESVTNFLVITSDKYDKKRHYCRYCEKSIYKNEDCIYDPQFDQLAHLDCLHEVRDGQYSLIGYTGSKYTSEKTKETYDYTVWYIDVTK